MMVARVIVAIKNPLEGRYNPPSRPYRQRVVLKLDH